MPVPAPVTAPGPTDLPADLPVPSPLRRMLRRLQRRLLAARPGPRGLAAFTLAFLAAIWALIAQGLAERHAETLAAELRQNANLAHTLGEQAARLVATVDQAMLRLGETAAAGLDPANEVVQAAAETGLVPRILVQLSVVGADGRFRSSNLDVDGRRTGPVDLSEREHIRVHLRPESAPEARARLAASGLFIGPPVLGKVSGRWTIQLTRPLRGPDGSLRGVAVASVDPAYFESVFGGARLGSHGIVALVGTDRSVRARVAGGRPEGMGTRTSADSRLARPDLPATGTYSAVSPIDRVERLYAHARVGELPLHVLVGTSRDEALALWRASRDTTLWLAGLLSLGGVCGAFAAHRGIRRLQAHNRALRDSEARAQSASRAKSDFLTAVSHELRTPLTSIRGFAELMEHRLPDARFREQAGLIRKGAEHLTTLLNDILDLSKIDAGAMTLLAQPNDVRRIAADTVEFYAVAAAAKGLALELHVDGAVPEQVTCDALRLKQVLNNLLSNAVKFTPEGAVTLSVEVRDGELQLHVDDTGPGIPAALRDVVFERFRQAGPEVAQQHGGTGLGLSLSRGLAELMGGRLVLAPSAARGARFTLALPLDGQSMSERSRA